MGRTNPTYRDLLQALEHRWGPYRRALRRGDQERFDRLFRYGRDHADAASHLNHESPVVPLLVGICLAQEQRIDELETRLTQPVERGETTDEEETQTTLDDAPADAPDDAPDEAPADTPTDGPE
ncbi:hypothetical protein RYH80_08265 [Halobaculum sp. MBLA0147]|uniref:hypothetical protein n=1 Tax=Halobaculum sp. MBLA0147 TaxID=3079934 RepID=UPI003525D66D